MNDNFLALRTLAYIWNHPNCKKQRLLSFSRFLGWQIFKRLTNQPVNFQLISGIQVRCYPDSQSASAALYCGLYDYDEMNFLLRYLRESDSFLDIGANIGVYTLLAAARIRDGIIYSFEALPKNFYRLQENLKLNRLEQVKACAIAISNQVGQIYLEPMGGDSLPFITETMSNSSIAIPSSTLDVLLQKQSLDQLTLAKIDIEGAEILALQGAVSLLQKKKPDVWIIEINDTVDHFGHHPQDVVDFLKQYGYSLYRYDVATNSMCSITLAQKQGNNVLAIADSSLDFVRNRLELNIS